MVLEPNLIVCADAMALLERIPTETAHLVYLDPPFFEVSEFAQGVRNTKEAKPKTDLKRLADDSKALYLDWLAKIIQQAHRVADTSGNVVIRNSPKINSYLRIVAERIFDEEHISEIVIRGAHRIGIPNRPRDEHESLLLCRRSSSSTYNPPYRAYSPEDIQQRFPYEDDSGRYGLVSLLANSSGRLEFEWQGVKPPPGRSWRFSKERLTELDAEGRIRRAEKGKLPYLKSYFSENAGVPIGTNWDDIPSRLAPKENTHYVSQQPMVLLERVINTTTNPADLVIDPFCGSGTSAVAAEMTGRRWIASDNSTEAIHLVEKRLAETGLGTDYNRMPEGDLMLAQKQLITFKNVADGLIARIRFIRNCPVDVEETRYFEFKEVRGEDPARSITKVADEYAIAYLNSEGGRVFWGVRDEDRVALGVSLSYHQRDDVRKSVINKLSNIQPPILSTAFSLEFHRVYEGDDLNNPKLLEVPDLFVVELTVPRPVASTMLYATGGGDVFIKTDSGKKKLSFQEAQLEIIRRQGIESS